MSIDFLIFKRFGQFCKIIENMEIYFGEKIDFGNLLTKGTFLKFINYLNNKATTTVTKKTKQKTKQKQKRNNFKVIIKQN